MMWKRCFALAVSAVCLPITVSQSQAYRPTSANPQGEQLVAVYLGARSLGDVAPGLPQAVDSAKVILASRANQNGQQFRAVGVALDWNATTGLGYLAEFGQFDELNVGRNWFGFASQDLLFADTSTKRAIPQVLIYRQRVDARGTAFAFGPRTIVRQIVGGDSIVAWVRAGANLR